MLRRLRDIPGNGEIYDLLRKSTTDSSIGAWRSSEGDLCIVCRFLELKDQAREHQFGAMNCRARAHVYQRKIEVMNGNYELHAGKGQYTIPARPKTLGGFFSYWEPPCGTVKVSPPSATIVEVTLVAKTPDTPSVGRITCAVG